jgi:hypothetical protein
MQVTRWTSWSPRWHSKTVEAFCVSVGSNPTPSAKAAGQRRYFANRQTAVGPPKSVLREIDTTGVPLFRPISVAAAQVRNSLTSSFMSVLRLGRPANRPLLDTERCRIVWIVRLAKVRQLGHGALAPHGRNTNAPSSSRACCRCHCALVAHWRRAPGSPSVCGSSCGCSPANRVGGSGS